MLCYLKRCQSISALPKHVSKTFFFFPFQSDSIQNSFRFFHRKARKTMVKSKLMLANDVEPMLPEDIPTHPNSDWQFYWDLFFCSLMSPKIPRCWFRPRVNSTNTIFSDYPRRFLPPLPLSLSLSLPSPLSLCLSLPNLLYLCLSFSPCCYIPIMFYLPWFPSNTPLIWWPVIIDRNKLISNRPLFHLEVAHNTTFSIW